MRWGKIRIRRRKRVGKFFFLLLLLLSNIWERDSGLKDFFSCSFFFLFFLCHLPLLLLLLLWRKQIYTVCRDRRVSKILMGFSFSCSLFLCSAFVSSILPKDIWQRRFKELNLNFFFLYFLQSRQPPRFLNLLILSHIVSTFLLSTRLLMEIKYHSVILHKM